MTTATNLSIKIALFSALFRTDVILTSLLRDSEREEILYKYRVLVVVSLAHSHGVG